MGDENMEKLRTEDMEKRSEWRTEEEEEEMNVEEEEMNVEMKEMNVKIENKEGEKVDEITNWVSEQAEESR